MVEETADALRRQGCRILHTQVNASGRMVYLILSDRDDWDVAMFAEDAADLVRSRATIDQVVSRNRGADLADPWPHVDLLRTK
jgi:hypothetical protein